MHLFKLIGKNQPFFIFTMKKEPTSFDQKLIERITEVILLIKINCPSQKLRE